MKRIAATIAYLFLSVSVHAQVMNPPVNSPIFPSTPSAGMFPIAQSGSTADWKAASGSCTLNSSGVFTCSSGVTGPGSSTANGFAVYNGTTGQIIKDHAPTIALGSEVTGTLPIANGGTNDTGTNWTSFTVTPTCTTGSATWGTAAGRFKAIGKTVYVSYDVTLTTNGGSCLSPIFLLPVASVTSGTLQIPVVGIEFINSGAVFSGRAISGGTSITLGAVGLSTASGAHYVANGVYESN